jgi:hypothetical protein
MDGDVTPTAFYGSARFLTKIVGTQGGGQPSRLSFDRLSASLCGCDFLVRVSASEGDGWARSRRNS